MAEPGDGEADQRNSGDKEEAQGEDARDSVATVSRKRKMEASDAKLASSAADATSSLRILRRKRLRYPRYTTLKEIHTGQAYSYGWFPTGFRALDELLGSREVPHGISTGEMIEVVGESSIGKTQLCMTVCGHLIRSSQERAIFIDTAHSFDPKRLQQIYVHSSRQPTKPIEKAFEQIHVYRVFNIFALHTLLVKIQDSMEKNSDSFYARMRLLVIDSLSALLAQNLGGDISSANAIIAETGRMIKHIAHKYQIAVLTTNHTVSAGRGSATLKPALGESWTYVADKRLCLYYNPVDRKERVIALTKSNTTESGGARSFEIGPGGIRSPRTNATMRRERSDQ